MRKIALLLSLVLCLQAFGQDADPVFPPDNNAPAPGNSPWFFGGNLGLSFGTITSVDVSPFVGYRLLDDRLQLALGAIYQYYSDQRIDFSTSIYGGRSFAQVLPPGLDMILLHAEFEAVNYEYYNERRRWVFNPLVGGGLRLPGGSRQYTSILVLWNLNGYSEISQNPVVRIGFNF